MKLNELKDLLLSKKELTVISSALVEFWQEMHWKLNPSGSDLFKKTFEERFTFSLTELEYVMQEIWELEWNFRSIDVEKICIFFSEMVPPKKSTIIYNALNECSKNYEDYEISIRSGISKEELDAVLKEFKEKVIDEMKILNSNSNERNS